MKISRKLSVHLYKKGITYLPLGCSAVIAIAEAFACKLSDFVDFAERAMLGSGFAAFAGWTGTVAVAGIGSAVGSSVKS